MNTPSRRPLKSRQTLWAQKLAQALAGRGISPNAISFLSMVFALLSFVAAFYRLPILAAIGIQLRLLCNLMDGMVAVEFNKKSKTGDLWNDVPDRVADVLIIMGAGIFCMDYPQGLNLGWLNGCLAVLTAYLRVLGASLASPHYFMGPMGKPHRMAILTLAYIVEAIFMKGVFIYTSLIMMALGQLITCIRRLRQIAIDLEKK